MMEPDVVLLKDQLRLVIGGINTKLVSVVYANIELMLMITKA